MPRPVIAAGKYTAVTRLIGRMKVEIKLDAQYTEPTVLVLTDRMTDEVGEIVRKLSEDSGPSLLTGQRDEALEILRPEQIVRIYSSDGKVYASTKNGEYTMRQRIYELEERLCSGGSFVRISNSEIINLSHAKKFDLSLAGTICVSMSDGQITYVSRRYVPKIKQKLGI